MINRAYIRFRAGAASVRAWAVAVVCAAGWLLATPARADLVWSADNGWQIQGGVLAPYFGDVGDTASALEAMNKAKTAQEAGSYYSALTLYSRVVTDYPNSVFAPEALYQKGLIYIKRHQWDKAYTSFDGIISGFPDYPRFNAVIGKEYQVAGIVQEGRTPYAWGWLPWFIDYTKAVDYYEGVIKNAPYSEYAPLALMNIATVAQKDLGKPEIAIDALDRLINNYPQSMLAPDAYLQMAATYSKLVKGAPYDQGSTRDAIRFYQDYLYLYKNGSDADVAQARLDNMMDVYARSKLILGNFYYYYRNSDRAALIFYNQAITLAPKSPAAGEARVQIDKIRRGVAPPLTPYDWVFGRYQQPSLMAYEEQSKEKNLSAESFQEAATSTFVETPGSEAVETIGANGQTQAYEGEGVPADITGPLVPPDEGFLTPVEQPQSSGPAAGQEKGGQPLIR
jgi:outer membrane protein assembly factor BamD